MEGNFLFLNLDGLDDSTVKHLNGLLHPSNLNPAIEFPWNNNLVEDEKNSVKGSGSSLNVHAPVFASKINNHNLNINLYPPEVSYNGGSQILQNSVPIVNYNTHDLPSLNSRTVLPVTQNYTNGPANQPTYDTYNPSLTYCDQSKTVNGNVQSIKQPSQVYGSSATFKLNPTVSCFVPSNFQNQIVASNTSHASLGETDKSISKIPEKDEEIFEDEKVDSLATELSDLQVKQNGIEQREESSKINETNTTTTIVKTEQTPVTPSAPRWADIVSRGQPANKTQLTINKPVIPNGTKVVKVPVKPQEPENLSLDEDKLALTLGKHLHQLDHSFKKVLIRPRGLINRRNWCYINATLQALLACPPFYTLLRDLPLLGGVERGKSATPIIDSMVKVAQEFEQFDSPKEELSPGQPFQPDFIYDMLRDLKSDCLKGQQEDAEEFLSFILNGMQEEMAKIMKNYEKKNNLNMNTETKENGDASESEEEWQVIGSKHKGMVTRKVAEHKTPISDLFGGQIKSFLTTSGNKTSASIQPFFTLQLDIQSEKVTTVLEALKEMAVKEPIQGYTCAKTKQEVEAYSHIALQKLPPILILHLKRFVYNKNGGCKKVMKKTDYPVELELTKDLFSSDVKKNQRMRLYKLFAVMYHDGEEAVKGHYISDVYNHGSQTWVRCDDRTISVVSEDDVLSHSPPRVPYLLFYQES